MPVVPSALLPAIALLLGGLAVLFPSPAEAIGDRDCGDFATQRAAQIFFLKHSPRYDPHRLDADGDGIACDSLPCPCYRKRRLPSEGGTPGRPRTEYVRVARVIDGDTVDVRFPAGAVRRVRQLGIDTPEVYGEPECGGRRASSALRKMLPEGTRVKLVSDPTQTQKDRYGRLLRYVMRTKDGRDTARQQVWLGNARVDAYRQRPFQRVRSYRKAQAAAKAAPRGVWRYCSS